MGWGAGEGRCFTKSVPFYEVLYITVSKSHKRLKRTLINQIKQDRVRVFEEILFLKATNDTKTNKSLIFLSAVGFLHEEVGTRLTFNSFVKQKQTNKQTNK